MTFDPTTSIHVGLDFMYRKKCVVNLKRQIVEISGKPIFQNKAGHIGCHRVVVTDTIHMPPRSETYMSCKVNFYTRGRAFVQKFRENRRRR